MATPVVTDPLVALAVINEAAAQGIHKEGMPADASAQVQLAQELVTLAEQAMAAGMAGGAATAVIAAAQQQPAAVPAVAPAPAAPAPPAPAPPAPPAPAADVLIQDAAGQQYTVPADQVEQYIAGGYTLVQAAEPTPPPPPPTPAPVPTPEPVAAAPVPAAEPEPAAAPAATGEPYPGYNSAKIPEIIAHIENVRATDGEQAKPLFAAIWEYESANKNRPRLLGKLKAIAEKGVETSPPVAAEPPAATAPVAPPAPAAPPVPAEPQPGVNPEPPFQQPPAAPPVAAPAAPAPVAAPLTTPEELGAIAAPLPGATQGANAAIAAEGLPIPGPVSTPPTLPEDFTVLSDLDVRKFQSQFNACQARALYLHSQAEGFANDAKLTADGAQRSFITSNTFPKGTTLTEIEAKAAESVPEISQARRIQHDWAEVARQYATLAKIYGNTCDRLLNERVGRHAEAATS